MPSSDLNGVKWLKKRNSVYLCNTAACVDIVLDMIPGIELQRNCTDKEAALQYMVLTLWYCTEYNEHYSEMAQVW